MYEHEVQISRSILPAHAAVEASGPTAEAAAHLRARDRTVINVAAAVIGTIARMRISAGAVPTTGIRVRPVETMTVIPRSGSDEDTPDEPRGTVVPVGCACIGIITIVAVRTDGCGTDISGANRYPNRNSRMRRNDG